MSGLQVIVLAIVQGLTEFLPISSSGHLVLVPSAFGWTDQGLAFDVAVHFGSLAAVLTYFRGDIRALLSGTAQILGGKANTFEARLALGLGLGTLPGAVGGLLLAGWISNNLRSPAVIAVTLSVFAVLMWLADRLGSKDRILTGVTLRDALLIGLAQMLALVPGTSRSGVTITAARALGFERTDAARFSFLLAVPVILLATAYELVVLLRADADVAWGQLFAGAVISGVIAYLSIRFFMRFVNRVGLLPFAIYRISLAAIILYVLV
ncbi:MAG: undecaprenyl-diphosphate phosphatase [Gammaproteobacteria bacterium]|nr:undecaprenyl-diphosphate phosphatase [Gammaproteobacteria bacterium]MDH5304435.1 undecaprenyl-diphosphate phosphatase [Gammaproteobacteria bacterium]MDH5322215.1 undecaprenyl-diphosphate phosphatase [Gammaproteobacteria bacterium]